MQDCPRESRTVGIYVSVITTYIVYVHYFCVCLLIDPERKVYKLCKLQHTLIVNRSQQLKILLSCQSAVFCDIVLEHTVTNVMCFAGWGANVWAMITSWKNSLSVMSETD